MENFILRISDQRSSFLRFIFKNSEPIIGMKSEAHKLRIVILQELVCKKLRIENGELKMENGKFQIEN